MKIYRLVGERNDNQSNTRTEERFYLKKTSGKLALFQTIDIHNKMVNNPEWIDCYGDTMLDTFHKVSEFQYEHPYYKYFIEEVEVEE